MSMLPSTTQLDSAAKTNPSLKLATHTRQEGALRKFDGKG